MTPRSKRYFARKFAYKWIRSGLTLVEYMIERARPIPKYPLGTVYAGGLAIVGEVGPEMAMLPDGRLFMTRSLLHQMELPINNLIIAHEAIAAFRARRSLRPIIIDIPFTFIDFEGQLKPTI